ncbi:DNA-binding response regulator [Flavobacterium longum]|uniref:LytR/AlgR family response regulator transcription factor n=1 Tax=Flavobacterium longum TaxID=1299340 RepID=UPI0039ED8E9B
MTTIIIEDEKPAARLLQRKLDKLGVPVQEMLHSVEEAIAWFSNHPHPELIFLDIQLSDGLSFEIFEAIDIKSAVIFTTAYDEYALKAFKLNSIDYLLKPIDEDELAAAVAKYRERQPVKSPVNVDFDEIRRLLGAPAKEYRKRFTIKVGQHLKVVTTADVECFYSENKGTYAHTSDNRDYLIDTTLEVLEKELDPTAFFRVSRKHIVPMASIKEITVYSNSRLKVILPTYKADEVIVSREKVQDFKTWLG